MNVESLDLNLLTTLDALLQEASVTRAARRLNLSVPAVSHALARLRETTGDPLLVRAGRAMVLTPHAEGLRDEVHTLSERSRAVLSRVRGFEPGRLQRRFVVHATDHMLAVIGGALDRRMREEAPRAQLQVFPNSVDDAALLRDGVIDLALGVYGSLSGDMRQQKLFDDRFVCVMRVGHAAAKGRMTLAKYCALEHVQVAPRGKMGGYIDTVLAQEGAKRHIARAVPYFLGALLLVSESDYVLTVSARLARAEAARFGLVALAPPLVFESYTLTQIWHPRLDADPAHKWLRGVVAASARGRGLTR